MQNSEIEKTIILLSKSYRSKERYILFVVLVFFFLIIVFSEVPRAWEADNFPRYRIGVSMFHSKGISRQGGNLRENCTGCRSGSSPFGTEPCSTYLTVVLEINRGLFAFLLSPLHSYWGFLYSWLSV